MLQPVHTLFVISNNSHNFMCFICQLHLLYFKKYDTCDASGLMHLTRLRAWMCLWWLADVAPHSFQTCYHSHSPMLFLCAGLCVCVCLFIHKFVYPSVCSPILLCLSLLPLTCHSCSMTACRRWPGMVWDMEYPWAKLDCKTLPASSILGMTPGIGLLTSITSFRSPWTPPSSDN